MKIAALADVKAHPPTDWCAAEPRTWLETNGGEVGPGDFMAFPTSSVPHHLKNPSDQDLVYLMGGENRKFEVADFPRLGKRMVKSEKRLRSMTYPMQSRLVH
jgi:uncharacterized cupin superfamily protein